MRLRLAFIFALLTTIVSSQNTVGDDAQFLQNLMRKHPKQFKNILDKKKVYEVQIIYTQIDRDENNAPHFKTYQYNVDTARYFYPASTVKFPMALLALEKINELNNPVVTRYTPMYHDSVYSGHSWVNADTTSEGGVPSVAHYIKKIFTVSDNDAFNRLYEWVGQGEANRKLLEKGYNLRILHRLSRRLTPDQNRHTEAVRFASRDSTLYFQPMQSNDSIVVSYKITKGRGYYDRGKLVRKPFNLSYRNYFSLPDQHEMLKAVVFPELVPEKKRFNLTSEDRNLILQYMSQLPTETLYPSYYKDSVYVDAYSKLLLFGCDTTRIPDNIRIFNKHGFAYGFSTDNAYIVDFGNGIEFLLSATIYTNKDQVFNDDKYEYETVAFPFMKNLGQLIYDYEKNRIKKYPPDLSGFRFKYELSRVKDK